MTTISTARDEFTQAWEAWHREHETRRADQHGFLAVTGLHWLEAEPQRFPGAPGVWSTGPDGPVVELDPEDELIIDGTPTRGRVAFGVIPERGGRTALWGDVALEVARRGGHDILRPRDPGHALLTRYSGTPTYAPDPRFVTRGRYQAFDSPRPTTVGASVEGLQHVYEAPGSIAFELEGRPLTLTAFPAHVPDALLVLFTDETSGVTTYPANRALLVDPPSSSGEVVLDFNRATNLPCAYTDFATCPLPPQENRLPVAVEAGERIPTERLTAEPAVKGGA